jgi:hypothetical protein
MSRAKPLFLIVVLAFVGFIIESISGFILWLVLPHGTQYSGGRNGTESTFIWIRQTWADIHDWVAEAWRRVWKVRLRSYRRQEKKNC